MKNNENFQNKRTFFQTIILQSKNNFEMLQFRHNTSDNTAGKIGLKINDI